MMREKCYRNKIIMALWREGKTYREIGERFGITTSSVYGVVIRMLKKEAREKSDDVDGFDERRTWRMGPKG